MEMDSFLQKAPGSGTSVAELEGTRKTPVPGMPPISAI
jgi:hypothetical protein